MVAVRRAISALQRHHGLQKRMACEQLEPRHLLATDVLITEFMANNEDTLDDGDGNAADWIELYNSGPTAVDLLGWHLTDDPGQLDKWTFPAVVLEPNDYLLVFASGQNSDDYVDFGGNLHANFALTDGGEYLALVDDALKIRHELAPTFPRQFPDVSYGARMEAADFVLVSPDSPAAVLIPTDDSLGLSWTNAEFEPDGDWIVESPPGVSVTAAVGFETATTNTALVAHWALDEAAGTAGAKTIQDATGDHHGTPFGAVTFGNAGAPEIAGTAFEGNGSNGGVRVPYDEALNPQSFTFTAWARAERLSGFNAVVTNRFDSGSGDLRGFILYNDSVGRWAFWTGDGSSPWNVLTGPLVQVGTWTHLAITFDAATNSKKLYVNGGLAAQTSGPDYLPNHTRDLHLGAGEDSSTDYFFNGAIDDAALFNTALDPGEIQDMMSQGVGDERSAAFAELIQTDLTSQLQHINASAYLRIPFFIEDRSAVNSLQLRMKYDDGFVAYLNGQEVARRNAVGVPPGFAAEATTTHADAAATVFEDINISPYLDHLIEGQNVLAIQGLNVDAADADFLIVPQLAAVSIALDETELAYFDVPTPGVLNAGQADGVTVAEVAFSRAAGTFSESFSLSLSSTIPEEPIYYTLDGSIPDRNSPRYLAPITIDGTTQVRARVIESPTTLAGPVNSVSYLRLGTDVQDFASQLPIMVIENFAGGSIPNSGWNQTNTGIQQVRRQPAALMLFEPSDGMSHLAAAVDLESRVGIRVRGAFSSSFDEPGYSLEAWSDSDDDDHDISPFGFSAESDWILHAPNPQFDQALIDNSFLFSLSNQMGLWAPKIQYVEAFVNTDGGDVTMADHVGLYVFTEKVTRAEGRLDFDRFSAAGTAGGWLLEINRMDSISVDGIPPKNFHTAGPDGVLQTPQDLTNSSSTGDDIPRQYNAYINYDDPSGYTINDTQRQAITDWFAEMEDVLYGRNPDVVWNDPIDGYARYIDVDSFVNYFILHELSKNGDGLLLSMWVYNPDPAAGGKLTFGPIWDADLGSFSGNAATELMRRADRLWYGRLFDDPNFMQRYVDRWQELRQDVLSDENMEVVIDGFFTQIGNEAAVRDGVTNWSARLNQFKRWVATRAAAIDASFVTPPQFGQLGGVVPAGFRLAVTGPQGDIYYTTDGSDPRLPDGAISPLAQPTGMALTIEINESSHVVARARDGSRWSGKAEAVFIVDAVPATAENLVISEINYHPPPPTAAEEAAWPGVEDDDFEFLELLNVGPDRINLAGLHFTAGITFSLPAWELAPGQHAVAVRNLEAFRLRYGTDIVVLGQWSGGLSNGGERLELQDAAGNTVSAVEFGDRDPWPQRADGFGGTLVMRDPATTPIAQRGKYYRWRGSGEFAGSPGTAGAEPVGVVINEVLTNTDDSAVSDSIELFNTTNRAIDLGGWFLSDSGSTPLKFEIPVGTALPPGGYLVFDENDFNPSRGVDPDSHPREFALNGQAGDDVWLVTSDGDGGVATFVDDVHFGAAASFESAGRIPGVNGWLVPMGRTTLGARNNQPRVGPLVISEVNYHPGPPSTAALALLPTLVASDLEYVELHNPSSGQVELDGWRIRGGVDFDFAADATLAAGETVVIVPFDPDDEQNIGKLAAFQTHYGLDNSVRLIGGYGGQLDNGGERIELQRRHVFAENPLLVGHLSEDEVLYDDLSPWPAPADGLGGSLQRRSPTFVGNSPSSWEGAVPTPGSVRFGGNLIGDFTGDGNVTAADIDMLYNAINFGSSVTYYDLDGSGVVTQTDVTYLREHILNVFAGDANLDRIVDASDLNAVAVNWWRDNGAGWADGDFNGDGKVNAFDLNAIGVNWRAARIDAAAVHHQAPRARVVAVAARPQRELRWNGVNGGEAGRLDDVALKLRDDLFAAICVLFPDDQHGTFGKPHDPFGNRS